MAPSSPTPLAAQSLIYGLGDQVDLRDSKDSQDAEDREPADELFEEGGKFKSIYVKVFEDMISDIIEYEPHLLSKPEVCFLHKLMEKVDYEQRYVLFRLCLRKPGKLHRLSSLDKFETALGSRDKIKSTLRRLCGTQTDDEIRTEAAAAAAAKALEEEKAEEEEREIIDLTLDDEDVSTLDSMELQYPSPDFEREATHVSSSVPAETQPQPVPLQEPEIYLQPVAGPSRLSEAEVEMEVDDVQVKEEEMGPSQFSQDVLIDEDTGDLSFFAEDESSSNIELRELLDVLTNSEIQQLAKQMKIKKAATTRRDVLIDQLMRVSSTQTTLSFAVQSKDRDKKGKSKSTNHLVQTVPSFPTKQKTQLDRLHEIVLERLGACIRINPAVFKFLRRLNMIYFRCTQDTPTLLTPAILSGCHKRKYSEYQHKRTKTVWRTRDEMLHYEHALQLEAEVDGLMDGSTRAQSRSRSVFSATPAPNAGPSPVKKGKQKEVAGGGEEKENAGQEGDTARMRDARIVVQIFEEKVWDRWKGMVELKGDVEPRSQGLERFEHGHILTRIVHKAADAYGILREYARELEIIEALLKQIRWRRGRRGRWHDRRVLIMTTHMQDTDKNRRAALAAVIDGLMDGDTHFVYRPKLERRLTKIEKKLKIPEEDRHTVEGGAQLRISKSKAIQATRVHAGLQLDTTLRVISTFLDSPSKSKQTTLVFGSTSKAEATGKLKLEEKGKSKWVGRNNEVVTVEQVALQWYEDNHGYKGYHCEGSITSTLFGLLFWDIIFAPIEGAFETPYQTAPLDIAEDTFYYSRREAIEKRLQELEDGLAPQIVEDVDGNHREHKTLCVGVHWDSFPREDLLEIIQCIDGKGLAIICRLLAEDYAQRRSGVPDLFLWNIEHKTCKFVEVKGPGDGLQENQKVWVDALVRASIPVETCHVEDDSLPKKEPKKEKSGKTPKKRGRPRKTPAKRPPTSDSETATEPESEEEDQLNESQYVLPAPLVPDRAESVHQPPQSSPPSAPSAESSQPLARKRSAAEDSDTFVGPPSPKRQRKASVPPPMSAQRRSMRLVAGRQPSPEV